METQKNDEKNIVLKLKHQLGRMMVQVDYMYRNDREMSRLDIDVMMERTRNLYDLLCDYQSGSVEKEVLKEEKVNAEINEGGELINRDVDLEIEQPEAVAEKEPEEEIVEEEETVEEKEEIREAAEPEENPVDAEEEKAEEKDDVEDWIEDWEDEEDEMFHVEPAEEVKNEEPAEPETPEIEDNSLAAQLQRKPVKNIRAELGINDKMMIINDLFKGSVERCNKSIDALNEFPTLSGAKVYMNELQVELQWDVKSQAYKTLNDLVERRFI